jgi:hypothetical protein
MCLFFLSLFCLVGNRSLCEPSLGHPFDYDLGVGALGDTSDLNEVTLCCHGYGQSSALANTIASYQCFKGRLIGFNFPDYGIKRTDDHTNVKYGCPQELEPLLFLLDYYASNERCKVINLYGFSAGGGAIINTLVALADSDCQYLAALGINAEHRELILLALSRGIIALDCPLKSVPEIIDFRGSSEDLELIARNYEKNEMNPIDALLKLGQIHLHIVIHFQQPDEALDNRDDALFIERLSRANSGTTQVVIGSDGGHTTYHASLWDYLKSIASYR